MHMHIYVYRDIYTCSYTDIYLHVFGLYVHFCMCIGNIRTYICIYIYAYAEYIGKHVCLFVLYLCINRCARAYICIYIYIAVFFFPSEIEICLVSP